MGFPMNLLQNSVHQELKRCFSDLPTVAHTAVHLNTITQKPRESAYIVSYYNKLHLQQWIKKKLPKIQILQGFIIL